jgi:nucleoside phosphorylase
VRLQDLDTVFRGFFSGGAQWAEIWAANTPLDVLRSREEFGRVYRDTIFGHLDGKISYVKLLLASEAYDGMVDDLRDERSTLRENVTSLSVSARRRLLVRRRTDADDLGAAAGEIFGFCATMGNLDRGGHLQQCPLLFYRLSDVAHPDRDRNWVLASPIMDGGAFSGEGERARITRFFRGDGGFVSVATLLGAGDGEEEPLRLLALHHPVEVRLLLVAALAEEAQHFSKEWEELRHVSDGPTEYYEGVVSSNDGNKLYHVFLIWASEMGSVDAAVVTTEGLREFRPDYVVLVGIAGGRAARVRERGNVVYGQTYEAYEYAKKETLCGILDINRPKPRAFGAGERLLRMANAANPNDEWRAQIELDSGERRSVRAVRGHVLSGCKVVATPSLFRRMARRHAEVAALEMESEGVHCAARYSNKQFIMIKGVSDLADRGKGGPDEKGCRQLAARACGRFIHDALVQGQLDLP